MTSPSKGSHVATALRCNEKVVDATPLLHDLLHGSRGAIAVSQALKAAVPVMSTTKHIVLGECIDVSIPAVGLLIQLLTSVCEFTTLSISSFSFIDSASIGSSAEKLSIERKIVTSSTLHTLNLTNLAIKQGAEKSFEALIRALMPGCTHLNIKGIAYESGIGEESRFFKALASSEAPYLLKDIQYVPNIFINNLILANAYGMSDKEVVCKIYTKFLLETLPSLFVFLLFVTNTLESITLYIDLLYADTPQIRMCLEEFRAFLLLCSSLQSVKLLLHGEKADSQIILSDAMGPLSSVMNKAFDCLGIYSEYKEDLLPSVNAIREVFVERTRTISSPISGTKNSRKFFTSLCINVFAKLNVAEDTTANTGKEYIDDWFQHSKILRETPRAFELFTKLFKELILIESNTTIFSERTHRNISKLSAEISSKPVRSPLISSSLAFGLNASSSRPDTAKRCIGSPTVIQPSLVDSTYCDHNDTVDESTVSVTRRPMSAVVKADRSTPQITYSPSRQTATKPQEVLESRPASQCSMTRSLLRRSDLQHSHTTTVPKATTSMQLSEGTIGFNTSGPISINDLLTRNSTANNQLRAELYSMLLDMLPEAQPVKNLARRVSEQEDALIELRNCVLLLVERIGPNALSTEDIGYVTSVLRGSKLDKEQCHTIESMTNRC
ncbi:Hypothetical protein GLP15_3464 [Giardia lamblia P15]|uniref:Uncharacterized protein n=1 Tax=Giardia intestinalis (strain P15) TaxID=658858 RepID=E1F0D5_GIAIA|nr:Hypothetical protein GLP15_3464 [Giardia lamblia P15]